MLWLNQSSYPEDKPEKSEVSAKNLYNRPTASYYSNSVSVLINKTWWVSQSNAAYRRVVITNICHDPQVIRFRLSSILWFPQESFWSSQWAKQTRNAFWHFFIYFRLQSKLTKYLVYNSLGFFHYSRNVNEVRNNDLYIYV